MKLAIVLSITLGSLLLAACVTTTESTSNNSGDPVQASQVNASLGARYLGQGDLKRARAKLVKALAQNGQNHYANFNYAMLLSRLKAPQQAEDYFRRAIALSPDETSYQDAFGIFLCAQGRVDEARRQFIRSATNPFNQTPEYAYNNAASCAMQHGRFDAAQTAARDALRENPRFPSTLLNLAELSLRAGKVAVADAYYSRYVKYGRHSADSLWLGIRIKRLRDNPKAVQTYAQRLKRDFPQARETLLYLESRQQQ